MQIPLHSAPKNTRRMASLFSLLLATVALDGCGCGSNSPPLGVDGGDADDAGLDASVLLCAADDECSDDLFCNGTETCLPGDIAAEPNGCSSGTPPCGSDDCDETTDSCICAGDPDADGDGHDSVACGGNDCDDSDPNRNPGAGEVCDPEGVDEDCNLETLGDTDMDGDGYISSACCNGGICGDDCDDGRADVRPAATEQCNAFDDNCDGIIDEPGAFCPTGMCVDQRCRAVSWEWVFGSTGSDFPFGFDVDPSGNVYLGVFLTEAGGDIDADGTLEPAGRYLVSIAPTGGLRWFTPIATATQAYSTLTITAAGEIVIPDGDRIVFYSTGDGAEVGSIDITPPSRWNTANVRGMAQLGIEFVVAVQLQVTREVTPPSGGPTTTEVLETSVELRRYDALRMEIGRRLIEVPGDHVEIVDFSGSHRFVALAGTGPGVDLGTGLLPVGDFLAILNPDLSTNWATATDGINDVAVADDGSAGGAGSVFETWSPPWNTRTYMTMNSAGFAVSFEPGGAERWTRFHNGPSYDIFSRISFDGRGNLFVSGYFTGEMDVRPRGRLGPVVGQCDAFWGLWGATDNVPIDARHIAGSDCEYVLDIQVDRYGAMLVLGGFDQRITLPSDTEYTTVGSADLFLLRISDI